MPRSLVALFVFPWVLICAYIFAASSTIAADSVVPPAEAVIPGGALPVPRLQYSEVQPGLLERLLFETTKAGPLAIAITDFLVGPGRSVQIQAAPFAALIEIEAGAPQLSVDGKSVVAEPGRLVGINQGESLTIDNRLEQRAVVARMTKLTAQGN